MKHLDVLLGVTGSLYSIVHSCGKAVLDYGPAVLTMVYIGLKIFYKIKREWRNERPTRLNSLLFACLIIWIFSGCGLVPSEHKTAGELGAEHSANATRQLESSPPPVNIHAGIGSRVLLRVEPVKSHSSVTESDSQNSNASSIAKLPLGYKLLLIGGGLLLIFFAVGIAWKWVRVNFPSAATVVQAGMDRADGVLLKLAASKQSQALTETDPIKLAAISADIAKIHEERANLAP